MLTYLFHVTVCWALLALVYALLLRRETFFHANRLYLLLAVVLGAILPGVSHQLGMPLPAPETLPIALPAVVVGLEQAEQHLGQWSVLPYLWGVYWAGVALAAARVLWGLRCLHRIAASGRRERLPDGNWLIHTPRMAQPCSFFRWIFVPKHLERDDDFDNMLAHEQAHARGWHSADVLLLEVLCALFWFHPLVYWYRRSLRTVHEFLADATVSRRSGRRRYGLLLLRQADAVPALAFANHFFQAPLKKRLLMLTRQASPAARGWKYCAALPALVLLVFFIQNNHAPVGPKPALPAPPSARADGEKQPEFPGGIPALIRYLTENIRYPESAKQARLHGKVIVAFWLDETGAVTQAEATLPEALAAEPTAGALAAEAVRVIRSMPRWAPAQKAGRAVSSQMSLPIQFQLE